ncbi:MAG TPA: DUF1116 domain-containing protein [Casimicrobiaceae bacterium]|jgi:hypothetical protein
MSGTAQVDDANRVALARVAAAQPLLVDIRPAGEVIAGIARHDLLHAGPPLDGWTEACGALRGAAAGTLLLAAHAPTAEDALEAAGRPPWLLRSGAALRTMCTFGGVIGWCTPVFVVRDARTGRDAYAAINEGRGAALRYGSTAPETLDRLRWLQGDFADVLGRALRSADGIDLFALMEQALDMGDDGHSRQKAASALFLGAIAPAVVGAAGGGGRAGRVLAFLAANDFFFLPLAMAAAKNALLAGEGVRHSTLVTAIAFNGVRGGIRVSGVDDWLTAPVPAIHGSYFKGYAPADAGPVIGDSEIMETLGLGAFAMAGAPALARYVGGTVAGAAQFTRDMYAITLGEHPRFNLPALDRRGVPFGIDARKVVLSGVAPVFNTGIAHREMGVGQIGAGYGRVPMACFEAAVARMPSQPD